ncbi:hypothetical protein M2282_004124 [Variovorax boronicumulans]|uniref:TagK domain-containing protein n=1 Tax=Variovorax boronicumulans TaxID=436515 RepID=UPI0024771FA6|nr:TagK domain-containing protein [Variovorax boronicumulans]MDH6168960.1 hypothetical protein [Variovorax boronicumulans]
MNAGNPHTGSAQVFPLVLRLTHSGGEARHGTLLIPPTGASMADAFQLCAERQDGGEWSVANLCHIAWRDEAGEWQLRNGSYTLMCACNGKRVRGGTVVPVAAGDTLELGLQRFVLEQGEERSPERVHAVIDKQERPSAVPEDTGVKPALPHVFELRELDGCSTDNGRQIDPLGDPFGVLDIAGARSRPVTDTLAELLGERSRPEARTTPSAGPPLGVEPTGALLGELHEEFVRVVQDPDQLSGRTDWDGFVVFGAEAAPTLEELSRQAETYPLLRDILQPREGVDQIIEEFDSLATSGLLDAEHPQDVLGLFAPELARDAKVPLPGLTRREHHDLSPDSHVRIGSMRTGDGGGDGKEEGVS